MRYCLITKYGPPNVGLSLSETDLYRDCSSLRDSSPLACRAVCAIRRRISAERWSRRKRCQDRKNQASRQACNRLPAVMLSSAFACWMHTQPLRADNYYIINQSINQSVNQSLLYYTVDNRNRWTQVQTRLKHKVIKSNYVARWHWNIDTCATL